MKIFMKAVRPAILCFLCMTFICGILYTGLVTGIAQLIFPDRANGSIIRVTLSDGTAAEYGSERIAQEFSDPKYLIGRPSGPTNLSSVSGEEKVLVKERIQWLKSLDPENDRDIPVDLITASGSGADPYISPEAAEYQVARIARTREISEDQVRDTIRKFTVNRLLGIWGEEGVNVLKVNLALDGLIQE